MGDHFILKCSGCGKVIAQCRCPSADKRIDFDICETCELMYAKEKVVDKDILI